ncbi:MAG: HAD-IIIA family hydrolase [Clostridia bacterium]|nr:HAD-IIIA family hydrolase [Clostridia bacterium]
MIKAALFDLDGTLTNSLKDLATAVNFAITKHGYPKQPLEKFNMFVGDGMLKMVERAIAPAKVDDERLLFLKEEFLGYYSEHYADYTTNYKGVPELLDSLRKKGIKIAVVTNKDTDMAIALLNKVYGDMFDFIIGKQEGLAAKPAPDSSYLAMKALGVTADECVFLGDSGVDMQTANNCGATAVGVTWGFRSKEELLSNGAKYIIDEAHELLDILEGK